MFLGIEEALGQEVRVNILNRTGHKVDSLTIETVFIRDIPKDGSTGFVNLPFLTTDSGYLYPYLAGQISGSRLTNHKWSRCGTERHTIHRGEFEFELRTKVVDDVTYFYLSESPQVEEGE
jgi:hypothetical protein